MEIGNREPGSRFPLPFQKGFVFVSGGAADVAHSRQFADIELSVLMVGRSQMCIK